MSSERRQKHRISYSVILFISNSRISKLTSSTRMRLGEQSGSGTGVKNCLGILIRRVTISVHTLAKIHQPVSLKSVCPVVCKLQLNKVDFKPSPAQNCVTTPAPAQLSPAHLSTYSSLSSSSGYSCVSRWTWLRESRSSNVLRPLPGLSNWNSAWHRTSAQQVPTKCRKEERAGGRSGPRHCWCRHQKGPQRSPAWCPSPHWHEQMEAEESKSLPKARINGGSRSGAHASQSILLLQMRLNSAYRHTL